MSYVGSPAEEAKLLKHLSIAGTDGLTMAGLLSLIKLLGTALDETVIPGFELHALGYIMGKTQDMGFFLFHNLFTPAQATSGGEVTGMDDKLMRWFYDVEHAVKQHKQAQQGAQMAVPPPAAQLVQSGNNPLVNSILAQNAASDASKVSKALKVNLAVIAELMEPPLREYLASVVKLNGVQICKIFEDGNLHPMVQLSTILGNSDAHTPEFRMLHSFKKTLVNAIFTGLDSDIEARLPKLTTLSVWTTVVEIVVAGDFQMLNFPNLMIYLQGEVSTDVFTTGVTRPNVVEKVLGQSKHQILSSLTLLQSLFKAVSPWETSAADSFKTIRKMMSMVRSEAMLMLVIELLNELLWKGDKKVFSGRPQSLFAVEYVSSPTPVVSTITNDLAMIAPVQTYHASARIDGVLIAQTYHTLENLHDLTVTVQDPKFPSASKWLGTTSLVHTTHTPGAPNYKRQRRASGQRTNQHQQNSEWIDIEVAVHDRSPSLVYRNVEKKHLQVVDAELNRQHKLLNVHRNRRICSRGLMFPHRGCTCHFVHASKNWSAEERLKWFKSKGITRVHK